MVAPSTAVAGGGPRAGNGASASGGGSAVEQAQERAQGLAQQARERARQQVADRAGDLGGRVSTTAEDLHGVAGYLRSQGRDGPAGLAEQAAERLSRAGEYLQAGDSDRMLGDVESLARERSWAVIVGGLSLGLAASRMLKASSGERYRRHTATHRGTGGHPSAGAGRAASAQAGAGVGDPRYVDLAGPTESHPTAPPPVVPRPTGL